MAWVKDDRLYPKEVDTNDEFQRAVLKVFVERYEVAVGWLRERFGGRRIRILDMACGSGYGSSMLSQLGEVVAVDIDRNAVDYARREYDQPGMTFLTGSADDQEFLESLGTFDAIVSIATIEHVEDIIGFLGWMQRSLNPGGICVLCFPASLTLDWASPHHRRDISPRQAPKLFGSVGFEIKKDFYQRELISLKDLVNQQTSEGKMPAPPLRRWISYYLIHPHHLMMRVFQFVFRGGFVFAHQEYLLDMM